MNRQNYIIIDKYSNATNITDSLGKLQDYELSLVKVIQLSYE